MGLLVPLTPEFHNELINEAFIVYHSFRAYHDKLWRKGVCNYAEALAETQ